MSVDAMKAALRKMADAPKTNEDEPLRGTVQVRLDPPGRAPGTLDAKWGDKPPEGHPGYPDVHGTAALREAHEGRTEMLERLFDSPAATASAEQALMRENFAHAAEGTPHSPMLQRGHLNPKTASADEETLTDAVMRVVGHR